MDPSVVAGWSMTTAADERLMDALGEVECRQLLATASIGRIAFTEGAMPSIQPASFAVRGDDVFIPTGLGSKMAAGSRGAVLAFEVDDYDLTGRTGWNVTVIGPSRLISDPVQVTALDALGVLPWAPVTTHCYIALHMAVVRGRRISTSAAPAARSLIGADPAAAPPRTAPDVSAS